MQRSIPLTVVGLVALACSGEPFSYQPDTDDAGSVARGGPRRPTPRHVSLDPPDRVALSPPRIDLMLARRGTQELVALDRASGVIAASQELEGPLMDLAFDGSRALCVVGVADQDATRVRAYELRYGGFESRAVSELFAPASRVEAYASRALVMSEDMGTSWALLDADLAPIAPDKLLVRPSGLLVANTRLGEQVVALNPNLLEGGEDADEIVSARFDSNWKVARTSFDASGRPDSRLAHQRGSDYAWVVRKQPDGITFQLGQLLAVDPSAPAWFETRIVAGATGSLDAVVVDAEHEQIVALLSRGQKPGALALVPLEEGAAGSVTILHGAVETSPWFSRQMLLHAGGALTVATLSGLEELRLGPSSVERVHELPDVRGPLAAAD